MPPGKRCVTRRHRRGNDDEGCGDGPPTPGEVPVGNPGARRDHRRRPAQGPAHAGLRHRRLRQDPLRHGVPRPRGHRVRRAGRLHGLRGDGRRADQERRARSASTSTSWSSRRSSPSTTSTSSAARSRRPASTTWRGCSSAWATRSTPSGPSGSCWTRWRPSSAASPTRAILRAELRRLFRWLKDKGVTAIITAERGDGSLTRHGLEEYVSDCVILLDHRVTEQVSTRRLRVVKYRGSTPRHQRVPVPDRRGRHLRPAHHLDRAGPRGQSASGSPAALARLDAMLGGEGYYRGSSVLVSGTAGTGKSSLAATFADAACRRGERCLYFAFEESPEPDRPQHGVHRHRPRAARPAGPPARSGPPARRRRGWRRTWRPSTRWSATSSRPGSSSWTRSPTSSRSGRPTEIKTMLMRLVDFLKAAPGHRPVHQPDRTATAPSRRPTRRSRRSSTPGCCCGTSSSTANETASCTSSRRGAWPTPTRCGSS